MAKLWDKLSSTTWKDSQGKTLSYNPISRLIRTDANDQFVLIPLAVMRSLLEDNGYQCESHRNMEAFRDEVIRFREANSEMTQEVMVKRQLLRERSEKIRDMSSIIINLQQDLDTATTVGTDIVIGLEAQLKAIKTAVQEYAQQLIDMNVVMPTEVVGKFMKEKFK